MEILPSAATLLDPQGITPSEISQRKTNTTGSHLHVESKNKQQKPKLTGTENRSAVARRGRWEVRDGWCEMGFK